MDKKHFLSKHFFSSRQPLYLTQSTNKIQQETALMPHYIHLSFFAKTVNTSMPVIEQFMHRKYSMQFTGSKYFSRKYTHKIQQVLSLSSCLKLIPQPFILPKKVFKRCPLFSLFGKNFDY